MHRLCFRLPILVTGFFVLASCSSSGATKVIDTERNIRVTEFLSKSYTIDQLYPSMAGPSHEQSISLHDGEDKLLWLLGYDVAVTDAKGAPLLDQSNLCHAQVTYADRERLLANTDEIFSGGRAMPPKWFIAIPGQSSIMFPAGFGIPMRSDEPLRAMTMVLNNDPDAPKRSVRMRTRLMHVDHADLTEPMQPLGRFAIAVTVPIKSDHALHHGEDLGCAVTGDDGFITFSQSVEGSPLVMPEDGVQSTAHFLVPPGTHVFRERFSGADYLPFDTTLHHVSAHLHVFGTSLELWDVTTNEKLFTSISTFDDPPRHVTGMTFYSSPEGIPVRRDHEYELRATYQNPTDQNIDAMAVMYFYFLDNA